MASSSQFIFLFLLVSAASAARTCPPCGNLSVPYPLSTSAACGDPSYKLRCDSTAGRLLLDGRNGSSYRVSAILPRTQRLIVRPSSFLPGACVSDDIRAQGLRLDDALPFNVTGSNTVMYFNCSDNILRSPLDCSDASLCHKYVDGSSEGGVCGKDANSSRCCTFRTGGSTTAYGIRVRGPGGCSAYRSFVNLDPTLPVARWPAPGLELEWRSPREPVCDTRRDCEAWGVRATCAPDPGDPSKRRCFCVPGLVWDPFSGACIKSDDGSSSNRAALIAGLTAGLGVLLLLTVGSFFFYYYYKRERRIKEARNRLTREREAILNAGGKYAKVFTGKEIRKATDAFSPDRLLGSGGYGEVFKGVLGDGTVVAVKCAKLGNTKSTHQVLNEVRILAQVNHRSLVRLLGCCVELQQPLMVYEYIPNGTLFDHLHGGRRPSLPWRRRLIIAHQTAEGLAYLHSSAVPPIYHRDVKSSNILLDEKLNAKVADFGLSRLAETDLSHISTCAQGTLGYLDPEYHRKYQLTDKSDVYSFGIVLLELLTSQKAIDFNREADDVNLAVYVQSKVEEEKVLDVVDFELRVAATQTELETFKALLFLALGCLEDKRQNRPSMKEVAQEIEYIMCIEEAKDQDNVRSLKI
ncbi:hypothetical protein H6P81_006001 [Aristolochia fimbriata]|uniref:Protein kinase domain-containing protein n=1 Tax=Aristolochia fimbriata TaxID=158543 RepID=A0AAV7EW90_ARIFI|nr:hypothetical protein H6P81_006001 [Aristolochia fimbriata]